MHARAVFLDMKCCMILFLAYLEIHSLFSHTSCKAGFISCHGMQEEDLQSVIIKTRSFVCTALHARGLQLPFSQLILRLFAEDGYKDSCTNKQSTLVLPLQ